MELAPGLSACLGLRRLEGTEDIVNSVFMLIPYVYMWTWSSLIVIGDRWYLESFSSEKREKYVRA